MKPVIFAHTADLHIGASGNRLDPTGLNAALVDRVHCGAFVAQDATDRGAGLILDAGDLWHTRRPTPTEIVLAANRVTSTATLRQVPYIVIEGNHTAPKAEHESSPLELLPCPQTVAGYRGAVPIYRGPEVLTVWRDGDGHAVVRVAGPGAQTAPLAGAEPILQVAAVPWPNRQRLLADERYRGLSHGELNVAMRGLVMDLLRGLRARCDLGVPAILLAHLSVDAAEVGHGRMMMEGAEWTLSAGELAGLGFDYVALGHIHKPQELAPNVWYPGSPEAVDAAETWPHSYNLVTIADGQVQVEQIRTPYRPHETIDLVAQPEWRTALAVEPAYIGAIVRVRLPEARAADIPEIRDSLMGLGAHEVRVEIVRPETVRREEATGITAEMSPQAALAAYIEAHPDLVPMAQEMLAEAAALTPAAGGAE